MKKNLRGLNIAVKTNPFRAKDIVDNRSCRFVCLHVQSIQYPRKN